VRIHYRPETDELGIEFGSGPTTAAEEIAPGVVSRRNAEGRIVALKLDRASEVTELRTVRVEGLPVISVAPLLATTFRKALRVFGGDVVAARRWFQSPAPDLRGATPQELTEQARGRMECKG